MCASVNVLRCGVVALSCFACSSLQAQANTTGASAPAIKVRGMFVSMTQQRTKRSGCFTKEFYGSLEAISSEAYESRERNARGSEDGSAEERVVGTLGGRQGSFVLEHTAANDLQVNGDFVIVAGSGSGQLRGITGHLMTDRHEKPYRYELIYSVPNPAQK